MVSVMKKKKSVVKLVAVKEQEEHLPIPEVHDRSTIDYVSGENFNFGEERIKGHIIASKFAFDLFKEEDATPSDSVRVKHFRAPNKNDRWKIFQNNKVIFTIDGSKLLKKEREFLNTVAGFQLLLAQGKSGELNVSGLKRKIKTRLK